MWQQLKLQLLWVCQLISIQWLTGKVGKIHENSAKTLLWSLKFDAVQSSLFNFLPSLISVTITPQCSLKPDPGAEPWVTSDLVERSDAAGCGVGEEATVQHHGPAQQVQPQEHGQSQDDLQLRLRRRHAHRGLLEVRQQTHRVGMNGHRCQLQGYQGQALGRHGNAPILCANVVNVELPVRWKSMRHGKGLLSTNLYQGNKTTSSSLCSTQVWAEYFHFVFLSISTPVQKFRGNFGLYTIYLTAIVNGYLQFQYNMRLIY